MGSFSWLKADKLGKIKNVAYDTPFKMLIPAEFGGGFIRDDHYQDFGYLGYKENGEPKYDIYELLAIWNLKEESNYIYNKYNGYNNELEKIIIDFTKISALKEIDKQTDIIRNIGINIGCYDDQMEKLKYPLKLVSIGFNGNYEDCLEISINDPNQGWKTYWKKGEK